MLKYLVLASVLLAPAAFAGENFRQGDLLVNPPTKSITLGGVTLLPGKADISIASRPWFASNGALTIATNGGQVKLNVPKKSYLDGGVNFMAYAADTGLAYNVRGTYSTTTETGTPFEQKEECDFPAKVVHASVQDGTDANGAAILKNVDVSVCVWATSAANSKSPIAFSPNGYCRGERLEKLQAVTTQNHYRIEFFDAKDPTTPVAVFNGSQDPYSRNSDIGSVSDCQ